MIKSEFYDLRYYLLSAFVLLMGLYFFSMPSNLTLEDDGFFVMSAWFNGVSHSPGYPLHTIFSHLATLIPIGSIPSRVHSVSAFFGALTALFLSLIVFHLFRNKMLAFFSALILGFSNVFWSQSIIAEVYTLNTFLFALIIYLALHIEDSKTTVNNRIKLFLFSAFFLGLGLANHWPLMILGCTLLMVLYYPFYMVILRNFPTLFLFLLLGLLPYAWMVYRSWQDPVFNFMGEINSFSDFWFIVSRAQYSGVDQSSSAGLLDKLQYALWFSKELFSQFFWVFSIAGLLGFIGQWFVLPKKIALALSLSFITSSYLLIGMLGFDFEPMNRAVIRVYFLPAYMLYSIWIATGLYIIVKYLSEKFNARKEIFAVFIFFIVALQALLFIKQNDRHLDSFSYDYTKLIFSLVPKNSILVIDDDITFGVFGYYHHVMGYRPDLTMINSSGLGFNNRLFHPIDTSMDEKSEAISNVYFSKEKEIYTTAKYDIFGRYGMIDYGIFYKFSPEMKKGDRKTIFIPEAYYFLLELSSIKNFTDPWQKAMREQMLARSVLWAMSFKDILHEGQYDIEKLFDAISETPMSALALLEQISIADDKRRYNRRVEKLIRYLEQNIEQLDKSSQNKLRSLKEK